MASTSTQLCPRLRGERKGGSRVVVKRRCLAVGGEVGHLPALCGWAVQGVEPATRGVNSPIHATSTTCENSLIWPLARSFVYPGPTVVSHRFRNITRPLTGPRSGVRSRCPPAPSVGAPAYLKTTRRMSRLRVFPPPDAMISTSTTASLALLSALIVRTTALLLPAAPTNCRFRRRPTR